MNILYWEAFEKAKLTVYTTTAKVHDRRRLSKQGEIIRFVSPVFFFFLIQYCE